MIKHIVITGASRGIGKKIADYFSLLQGYKVTNISRKKNNNPKIINYSCDTLKMRCGKAIISPTGYNSYLTEIRFDSDVFDSDVFDSDVKPSSSETFIVEVLYDADGEKIYRCPFCKIKTGIAVPQNPTNTSLFSHIFDCPNKNKIPIEA